MSEEIAKPNPPKSLMNQREYAKYIGRSAALINRWCQPGGKLEGAVERIGKGGKKAQKFIRVDVADALIEVTMDLSQQRIYGGSYPAKASTSPNSAAKPHQSISPEKKEAVPKSTYSYQDALIKDKYYAAALKKIKLDQENSVLVPKADVEKEAFEVGRQIRDTLQNIPSRISATLSALNTETEIEKILDKEIRQSLEVLIKQ